MKKMGWVVFYRYYRSSFAWKFLYACRNVKRNGSFMYQNTFITKITEWMNYKSWIMWVTNWYYWILGALCLSLGGLLVIRVYIHRLRRHTSRRHSRLARHTRCLRFAALPKHSDSFPKRDLSCFDSLDSALFARTLSRCLWRILLLYLGFIARCVVFMSIFNILLLITFELQTFVYLCSSHFTKLSKFYTYV
jgi:hypothetical protein